jgi:hypothetical protein
MSNNDQPDFTFSLAGPGYGEWWNSTMYTPPCVVIGGAVVVDHDTAADEANQATYLVILRKYFLY